MGVMGVMGRMGHRQLATRPPATGQTAPTKVRAKRDESEAVEIFRFMTIFCLTSVSWCGRLILLPQKELRPK